MTKKVYNFNPGPAILPREVLEQVQAEAKARETKSEALRRRSQELRERSNQLIADGHRLLKKGSALEAEVKAPRPSPASSDA